MSLNIKNPRVHQLAREAARVSGKTQTGAIEEALEHYLKEYGEDPQRAEKEAKMARIQKMIDEIRQLPPPPAGTWPLTIEDLYDPETGLPW